MILFRLWSNVKQCKNIKFRIGYALKEWRLLFSNATIMIIQPNNDEPLYINWENFSWYIDLSDINNNFWLSSKILVNDNDKKEKFIHIKISKEFWFDQFKIVSSHREIKEARKYFSNNCKISENDWEIIVLY